MVWALTLGLAFVSSPPTADRYEEGRQALHAGDSETGLTLLREAAAAGDPSAQQHLSYLYTSGAVGPAALEKWLLWLEDLAEGGDPIAQFQLGKILITDEVREAELERGVALIERAAGAGVFDAQMEIAGIRQSGRPRFRDEGAAISWYARASATGDRDAQAELGRLLFYAGKRFRDRVRAYVMLSLASRQGHSGAEELLAHARKKMNEEQIVTAEREVAAWRPPASPVPVELQPDLYLAGFGGVTEPRFTRGFWPEATPVKGSGRIAIDVGVDAEGTLVEFRRLEVTDERAAERVFDWVSRHPIEPARYEGRAVATTCRVTLRWRPGAPVVVPAPGPRPWTGTTGPRPIRPR